MPRYVILEHDHPVLHWDLLLEVGEVLKAWRLWEKPQAGKVIGAEASFDHQLIYLDYEGPVSGGRGQVTRWDHGECDDLQAFPDLVACRVRSARWSGTVRLQRISELEWQFHIDV